jgi:hypothetical protein
VYQETRDASLTTNGTKSADDEDEHEDAAEQREMRTETPVLNPRGRDQATVETRLANNSK